MLLLRGYFLSLGCECMGNLLECMEKKMYGQFVKEITDDVDETKSWIWVRQSDLKSGTASLIFPLKNKH